MDETQVQAQTAYNPTLLSSEEKRVVEAEKIYFELKYRSGCNYIRGLTTVQDPRLHKNWQYFKGVVAVCNGLDINIRHYLRCVLWRTADDMDRKFEVFPGMLISNWALKRFQALKNQLPPEETNEKLIMDMLSTLKVSRNFLRARARGVFGTDQINLVDLFIYQRKGRIQAEVLRWIESGALSRYYLAVSQAFWTWVQKIPSDIRDEYIPVEELQVLRGQLLKDPALASQIQEIVGLDYLPFTEGEIT